jgi:hypothetical protein
MTPEFISEAVNRVTSVYGADRVTVAREGEKTLVRIEEVELYATSEPPATPMLLVLDPKKPKPMPYVQPGQRLASGGEPRSTSVVLVAGESWLQFSFNIPWSEEHGIIRFIAAARQRFAQND